MTERVYYADSYRRSFSARVVERLEWEGQPAVVLDRTAFYPTSGGQPADRGTLGGVVVVDVVAREADGAVIHVLDRPLIDDQVEGQIDWLRRFDHMQQHTGQHILSSAFEQLLGGNTVGFHMGVEASTVDIDLPRLEPEAVLAVENLANQVIWEDRPVTVRLVEPKVLASLPTRRPPTVKGPVRIVDVAGFDVNACGGTHVARTGEIGMIKIVRLDHRGNDTRVEFLCGQRAVRDYQAKNEVVHHLSALLTVGYWELEQAVERLQAEAKHLRAGLRKAQGQLLEIEAGQLADAAPVVSEVRVVRRVWEGREPGELRALAQEMARLPGMVALLASIGERVNLCFARSEDVGLDVGVLLRETCASLGGKGGGRPHLAQGSAPVAEASRVEALLGTLSSTVETGEPSIRYPPSGTKDPGL